MFKIEFKTGGEAFRDPMNGKEDNFYEAIEAIRILEEIKNAINCNVREGKCIDKNGNIVGRWSIE